MRPRAALLPSAICLLLAFAPGAQAGYFPGQVVEGPSADVESLGGVDLARDGGGHVVYLKRTGGVNHVFASQLVNGAPTGPRQVDVGQALPSSDPRIGVADDGRAAAVWISAGSLWGAVRPRGGDWGSPEVIYGAPGPGGEASDPHLSMGRSGAAYATFHVNGDVRVARLAGSRWALIDEPLDVNPARAASGATIATSGDGTALAAWAEDGTVYARRVVRTRLSRVPQSVSVGDLDGQSGGFADSPSVDIQDDSSYAWVALRQDFGGVSRVIARRLIGSQFDPPVAIDANSGGAAAPDLDLTGRGRGLTAIANRDSRLVIGASMGAGHEWNGAQGLGGPGPVDPRPVAGLAENGRGTVAWQEAGAGGVQLSARHWNARRYEDPVILSDAALGPVDAAAGLDAAGDSGGNQAIAYVQGTPGNRSIHVAVFDKEPRATGGGNHNDWDRTRRFRLKWSKVSDDWGTVRYRVEVNGEEVTTTTRTAVTVKDLPDGHNVYNVYAIDSRGQFSEGPGRAINIDLTPPAGKLVARRSKAGRPANIVLDADDGEAIAGSGVKSAIVRYGDGGRSSLAVPKIGRIEDAKLGYRYRRPGRYTVRVQIRDVAGNKRNLSTRVVVRR